MITQVASFLLGLGLLLAFVWACSENRLFDTILGLILFTSFILFA
jgi:hypothetical protein